MQSQRIHPLFSHENYFKRNISERTTFLLHMKVRPNFPECRRKPLQIAVALVIVLAAVLLVAGCSERKSVQEQDIEIVDVNSDGIVTWNTTIDYGNDEEMRDIIEMDDGSFIIAGGSSPKRGCTSYGNPDPPWYVPTPSESQLICVSKAGEFRWLRNYSFNGNGGIISVFKNTDGTLNAITKMGEFWHLQPDGSVISHRSVNIPDITSAVRTRDGGYLIVSDQFLNNSSGSNITELDPVGTKLSEAWFDENRISRITPPVELPGNRGYLFGASHYNESDHKVRIVIATLSPEGKLINETSVAKQNFLYSDYVLQAASDGYLLSYIGEYNQSGPSTVIVKIDSRGTVAGTGSIKNLDSVFIPTNDGGYLSIRLPLFRAGETDSKKDIEIKRLDKDGMIRWKNTGNTKEIGEWRIKKIIETSDDGFVIMVANKKMARC
jgi:hypothetical protein